MQNVKTIKSRNANRDVTEIDLTDFFPKEESIAPIDLKDFLFKGLIVREADFRKMVNETNWNYYNGKFVCIYCSTDAIVPMWAFMLISVSLAGIAEDVAVCKPEEAYDFFHVRAIQKCDFSQFAGKRVIVKGCGERQVSANAFALVSYELGKVARSVMYGEACSSVPVFKRTVE